MEYSYHYEALERCIKSIRSYRFDAGNLAHELHKKLSVGLDKAPGNDIKKLKGELSDFGRIKIGKNNEFRLAYKLKTDQDEKIKKIVLLQFGKSGDPKKEFYPEMEEFNKKYQKNPSKYPHIPIKEYSLESPAHLKDFINEGYRYSLKFDHIQKKSIETILEPNQIISYVRGVPGSGKSVVGAQIAFRTFKQDQDKTILIVIPNYRLFNNYSNFLTSNGIPKENIINMGDVHSLVKNKIHIITLSELRENLLGISNAQHKQNVEETISAIEKSNRQNFLKGFSNPSEILDFYNAFFDKENRLLEYPMKDALNKIYTPKIQELEVRINELENLFSKKNLVTRKHLAFNLDKVLHSDESHFKKFIDLNNSLTIIVDEVQDLILPEWHTFVKLCIDSNKKNPNIVKLVFLGDEKQRVSISGFTWNILKKSTTTSLGEKLPYFSKLSIEMALTKNYRVTKEIADFVSIIDDLTITDKARTLESISKDQCATSKEKVQILKADLKLLDRALERIKKTEKNINRDAKVFVISEDIEDQLKDLSSNNFDILSTYEAKGTENNTVVLLNPFMRIIKDCSKDRLEFEADQNYKLYTMATRSNNALIVLLNQKEYDWFERITQNMELPDSILFHPPSEDSCQILEEIFLNVGLDELSTENIHNITLNRLERILKEPNYNFIDFYNGINDQIVRSANLPSLINDIRKVLKEYLSSALINYTLLNSSINSFHEKDLLFYLWYDFNGESIKARILTNKISDSYPQTARELASSIEQTIKGKAAELDETLLDYVLTTELERPIIFHSKMHKEYWNYFNINASLRSENNILASFLNNKLLEIKDNFEKDK